LRLAELWSASDILLADRLDGCRLAVLVACASGAGIGRFDEAQAGLPVGLQLAGIDSVIATRWEVDEGFAALWAERFYAGLAQAGETADLAALVRATCEELRDMDTGAARERLLAMADAAGDPFAAMALEAYAHRLPDPPFAAPSQWAAFFLTGRPTLELAA
jgi:CHAT domain-containing protein